MKRKKIIPIVVTIALLVVFASCKKETIVEEQHLPVEITNYISAHFPTSTITKAVKEKDGNDLYEISLSSGAKLEFNKSNEVIDIDGVSKLPDSVIPNSLLNYASSNYPTNYIIGWERKTANQEIELNNAIVIVFTLSGDFLRVDD